MDKTRFDQLERMGFAEVSVEDGFTGGAKASKGCSGARSECCTRVCSRHANFVSSGEAWDKFLSLEGGQVQY